MFPFIFIILDGLGIAPPLKGNAVSLAKTPCLDNLLKNYPHTLLETSGKSVGLPNGIRGNSEAGHLNLGAGRIVLQDSYYISMAINKGNFFQNPVFLKAINHAKKYNSDLHLMGLLSNEQTAHSSPDHLFALLIMAQIANLNRVFLHFFLDGRDSPPKSAINLIKDLQKHIDAVGLGKIATLCGRYYAMDRATNWSRTEKTYNLLTQGRGKKAENIFEAIQDSYKKGITDEFFEPTVIDCQPSIFQKKNGEFIFGNQEEQLIKDNDAVIFFNLRSDRARHLVKPFVLKDFKEFKREIFLENLYFAVMTDFGADLPVETAFYVEKIENSLPKILADHDLKQLYIAETEKFAHVTYFFHGGNISALAKENRILVHSVECETYDQIPQMSASEITQIVLDSLQNKIYDFILINFANPDMIGHTGNLEAAIKSIEFVDIYLEKIIKKTLEEKGTVIVTADHGNVEEMINLETGEIDTQHSLNPVPFIIVSQDKTIKLKEKGILANVSPTVLDLLKLERPEEMGEGSLIIRNS